MIDDGFKKILIVEDDLTYRDPMGDFLAAHSFTIANADNGEMAMEKLLFHHPDLVILDMMLPKVDGFEVLKRIRSYPDPAVANLPIIILSNLSGDKDIESAKALGASAYLIKSNTTKEDVEQKVEEFLFPNGRTPGDEVLDFSKMGEMIHPTE